MVMGAFSEEIPDVNISHLSWFSNRLDTTTFTLPAKDVHESRALLPTLLSYYTEELAETNPALFAFLDEKQRNLYKRKLTQTYYLLLAQYSLDLAEHRWQALAALREQMSQCNTFLEQLDLNAKKDLPETAVERELLGSDKPVKYCGLTLIAPHFIETVLKQREADEEKARRFKEPTGVTGSAIQGMTWVNNLRLFHWVWGTGLVASVIDLLPDDFYNKDQAKRAVGSPGQLMGYMSWVLYYTRFGMNLMLVFKHTFAGPWMSEEEKSIPWQERLAQQWQQRMFTLLNDGIWGFANMLCFYILKGPEVLGMVGNIVTAGLLIMDASLTALALWREAQAFDKNKTALETTITQLNHNITAISAEISSKNNRLSELHKPDQPSAEALAEIAIIQAKISNLLREKEDLQQDKERTEAVLLHASTAWAYKKYGMINDLSYAIVLLLGFALTCCTFSPPVMIAGAVVCFLATLITKKVSMGVEIARLENEEKLALEKIETLKKECLKTTDENQQKRLYLEIEGLRGKANHAQAQANFQKIKLAQAVVFDTLLPVMTFTAFLFLPLGMGLAVMAAGLAVALVTNMIINRYAPKRTVLPGFDEPTLDAFLNLKNGLFFPKAGAMPEDKPKPEVEDVLVPVM